MLYKNSRFKRIIFNKHTTNLKTIISRRSLRNLSLLLLLFEFNSFFFLINKIDNIINTSVSCELPPMALLYHYHVTTSVSRDQYTTRGRESRVPQIVITATQICFAASALLNW